jgi:hypothetical protein
MGPRRGKGEAGAHGLRCVVERRPGEPTAVRTPDGTLVLHDLGVAVFVGDEP